MGPGYVNGAIKTAVKTLVEPNVSHLNPAPAFKLQVLFDVPMFVRLCLCFPSVHLIVLPVAMRSGYLDVGKPKALKKRMVLLKALKVTVTTKSIQVNDSSGNLCTVQYYFDQVFIGKILTLRYSSLL